MQSTSPVVEIQGLSKHFGEFVALDGLTLSLNRGSILGFIGPNGAGKTTTIRILVGLSRPTSGTARIAGVNCVTQSDKVRRLVGYMPDRFGSYDNMRVREYLDFFGAAFGIPRRLRQIRIGEVLELTNADWMKDRYVESLSHGMQQRIGIARTMLHNPDVLILDEPANGLDPEARIEMRKILLRLAAEGKTLIVTSHILPELSRICDRVAIISDGQLRAFGSLSDVTRQLTQQRTTEVEFLDNERLGSAAELIREFLGETVTVDVSETETMVRFRSSADDARLTQLLQKLVETNHPVSQFRELAGDLEEAFISVTRGTDADAQSATAAAESAGETA
jgi:ABC-2 type transport system ATP-binding protein